MKMLSTNQAKWALRIIVPLFLAVLSISILATKVPTTKYMEDTIQSLDESKEKVIKFTGATMATSVAVSALPDDFATPLANSLANMNKYFVFILIVLFCEKLMVLEGTKIAFAYVIPIACGLYILAILIRKEFIRNFAIRLAILGGALVLVIPVSTHLTNAVCADYLAYVDDTIDETNAGADKINGIMSTDNGDQTLFEKLTDAFKTAIQGVSDLLSYFNNIVKKCINSIAILIVTNFVVPMLILFFFRWLLQELFKITIPKSSFSGFGKKIEAEKENEMIEANKS